MVDQFLCYLRYEKNRSELTVERYAKSLVEFQNFFEKECEGQTWETVDADIIRAWMERLMDSGRKAASVNADLAAIRTFYRFALARGKVKADPARYVTGPKKQKPPCRSAWYHWTNRQSAMPLHRSGPLRWPVSAQRWR